MPLTPVPAPEPDRPAADVPLPLSARAAPKGRPAPAEIALDLGGAELPDGARRIARERWALTVTTSPGAVDAWRLATAGALLGQARAEQVIRAFSARTNLTLAGARAAVVGDGPIAGALTSTLVRIGVRVLVVSGSPSVRLRARLAGLADAPLEGLRSADLDHVFLAGEGHEPVGGAPGTGRLLIDASPAGTESGAGDAVRPGVRALAGGGWLVGSPPLLPPVGSAEDLSGLDRRVVDVILALALLATRGDGVDPARADALLAELVVA